jgi:hypothetical protein
MKKTSVKPTRKPGRPATGKTPQRVFRMADAEFAKVQAAAEHAETTVSEWIRARLLKGL